VTLTRVRVLVEGVVQGVGYRAFVTQAARALRVNGIVRNLPDGRVEIFCDGDSASLDKFLDAINKKGDPKDFLNINVAKMQPFWEAEEGFSWPDIRYEGFQIDYGMVQLSAIDGETLDGLEYGKMYFANLGRELNSFRMDTNDNFKTLDEKYGAISSKLDKLNSIIQEFVRKYFER
jgi:acylphosphatase